MPSKEQEQTHEVQWTAGAEIARELVKRTLGLNVSEIELSRNENPPFIASATARIAELRGLKVITRLAPFHYPIDKLSPPPPTQQIELQLHQYQKERETPLARVITKYNPRIGDVLIETSGLGKGVLHGPTRWSNLTRKDIGEIAERLRLPKEDLAHFFQESILLTSPLARKGQTILTNVVERLTQEKVLDDPDNLIFTLPQNYTVIQETAFTLYFSARGGDYLIIAQHFPSKDFNDYIEKVRVTLLHVPLDLVYNIQPAIKNLFSKNPLTNPFFLRRYEHFAAEIKYKDGEEPRTTFAINHRQPEKRTEMDAHTLGALTDALAEAAESLLKRENVART